MFTYKLSWVNYNSRLKKLKMILITVKINPVIFITMSFKNIVMSNCLMIMQTHKIKILIYDEQES